jgi:hypothetical protein
MMTTVKGSKRRLVSIVSVVLATASIISVGVFSAKRQRSQQQQRKHWLTVTPEVASEIDGLEIINQRIIRQDTELPGVAFEIRNNSKRTVMAIEIACGEGSIAKDGLEDEQHPTVIIEPYGTLTAEMNGELTPGKPIVITAAIFDGGKEEGEKSSLSLMHRVRARQRAVNAQKEQPVSERSPKQ